MAKDQRWPTCPLKGNGWINHITASFTAIKKNDEPIQRPLQDILLNEKKKKIKMQNCIIVHYLLCEKEGEYEYIHVFAYFSKKNYKKDKLQ